MPEKSSFSSALAVELLLGDRLQVAEHLRGVPPVRDTRAPPAPRRSPREVLLPLQDLQRLPRGHPLARSGSDGTASPASTAATRWARTAGCACAAPPPARRARPRAAPAPPRRRPSSCRTCAGSIETTSAVRLRTSGRPAESRICPRTAGITTLRVRVSVAAATNSAPRTTWTCHSRTPSTASMDDDQHLQHEEPGPPRALHARLPFRTAAVRGRALPRRARPPTSRRGRSSRL